MATTGPSDATVDVFCRAMGIPTSSDDPMFQGRKRKARQALTDAWPWLREDAASEIADAMREEDHMGGAYVDAEWVQERFSTTGDPL